METQKCYQKETIYIVFYISSTKQSLLDFQRNDSCHKKTLDNSCTMGNWAFKNWNECLRKLIDVRFESEIIYHQLIQRAITAESPKIDMFPFISLNKKIID